ncbi:MAG: heavy metal translocating P-type ATPase [Nannocystaceae bacterium]|nr:heavy metal translocating P-type ATPase [bacterium]
MSLTPCDHCGIEVPADTPPIDAEAGGNFCCSGCATAYALIHSCGLEAFYRMSEEVRPVDAPPLRYAEFDRADFLQAHTLAAPGGELVATLGIDGMHCATCVWLLERLPQIVPGVVEARVDWRRATLTVRWRPEHAQLSAIADRVAKLGYRPFPLTSGSTGRGDAKSNRGRIIQLALAFAAAGNNMLIATGIYLGAFSHMSESMLALLRWASCAVGVFSLLGPGRTFFTGALASIRSRSPHMDLPVALGLAIGGIAGLVNTITGRGEIYFDTLSVLVFLLLLGRWLQMRQQDRAASALDVLYRVTPRTAHRVDDDGVHDVPGDVLQVGDLVEVRVGDVVPADGEIVGGTTTCDQAVLTGESTPVTLGVGDAAAAGTTNLGAVIRVRIEAIGSDTRIGGVLGEVEEAATERAPIVRFADRIAGWFVAYVLLAAAITFAAWTLAGAESAVDHTVALLIVACPCALGLATPLAISVALGRAARRKILIKGGEALQRLSKPGRLWLDKTGTITQGAMKVVEWTGSDADLASLAALEAQVTHPIASAIVGHAARLGLSLPDAEAQAGVGGITGRARGHDFAAGHAGFIAQACGAEVPTAFMDRAKVWVEQGYSPLFVARGGQVVGAAALGDPLREDAKATVAALKRRGWSVGILSGDHPSVVRSVGAQLGLPPEDCRGGLLPGDKVRVVEQRGRGPTVMVGDGVNDSAALMAASVGVAVRNGAEASMRAAPVYLARPDLGALIELLDGARSTVGTIRMTLGVSLGYNAIAVTVAAFGFMTPLVAALLMPASSLSVIAVALSRRFARA